MPRDGSNIYHIPPGTLGIPDTTVESNKYNAFVLDMQQDLNTPRPVVAGGTGASSPDAALVSLSAEKANQIVVNYDSFAFMSGSFSSAIGATAAPVALHAFSGIAYVTDANNAVVEARDMTDPGNPIYVRVKTAGVWSAWATDNASQYVRKTGDAMTGLLVLSGDPEDPLGAATKQYVDAEERRAIISSPTPPPTARDNTLWWESDSGLLYIRYNDGNTTQWVLATPQPDITSYLLSSGAVMTGSLTMTDGGSIVLDHDPVLPMEAATKQYVDAREVRAGTVRFTICGTAEVGWRLFDDGTIGNTGSGSTYSNANAVNLFTLMFNNFTDTVAPIMTSAGAATTRAAQTNAATAWTANCRMSLPKVLGRALGVAGSGAGLSGRQLGETAGEETHTPKITELPTHSHGGISGSDSPDHTHGIWTASGNSYNAPGFPGVSNVALGSQSTGASNRHSHSILPEGGNVPFNVMSPTAFLNAEIKL